MVFEFGKYDILSHYRIPLYSIETDHVQYRRLNAVVQWSYLICLGNGVWNAFDVAGHDLPALVNPSMALLDSEGNETLVTFGITDACLKFLR